MLDLLYHHLLLSSYIIQIEFIKIIEVGIIYKLKGGGATKNKVYLLVYHDLPNPII